MENQKFKLNPDELETLIKLYMLKSNFLTPSRIYARWKLNKLKLLRDYELWPKSKFMKLFKKTNENEQKRT